MPSTPMVLRILVVFLALCVGLSVGYSVSGNKILDNNGKPILLRGIARPSLEWNVNGEGLSQSDYQKMKDWGANVVRIGLNQGYWVSGCKEYNSGYQNTVDQQVKWINALGMVAILDLHWSNKGNANEYSGQQVMPDSISTTFWTQVATKYKNNQNVIFELYNEPHDVSWSVWKNGGDTGGGWKTPGFQALYNAVRATGAQQIVIVSGLNYAYDLTGVSSNKIDGVNIAYSSHPYDFGGKQPGDWDSGFGFLAASYPIIVTEFGEYNCNPQYVQSFIDYANKKQLSWTAWGWYPQGCGFPSLISDWNGTPSADGAVVKNSLQKDSKVPGGSASATATTKSASATTKSSTTKASTTGSGSSSGGSGGSNSKTVYADTVVSPFQDYSWATTRNNYDTSKKNSGSASYSFTPKAYEAIYFFSAAGIDTNKHKSITFYVNGGSNGGQKVNIVLVRNSGSTSTITGPDASIASYLGKSSIPGGNVWTKGTVDLSKFPSGTYDGIWIQDKGNTAGATLWIDDVQLVGK